MSFSKLQREVVLPVRTYRYVIIGAIIGSLLTNVMLLSVFGAPAAFRVAASEVSESDACGITDPAACVREMVESIETAVRPVPAFTVTMTRIQEVDCEVAEMVYWDCTRDAECPLSVLEASADNLNICQAGSRR